MKPCQFQFSPNAERQFGNLPGPIQKRVLTKLYFWERLKNPFISAKKLTGEHNIYRFRIGDYRVIVIPKDKEIFVILLILKIGHRKEVYK